MLPRDFRSVGREPVSDSWVFSGSKWRLRLIALACGVLTWVLTQVLHFLFYPVVDENLILRRMPADAFAGVIIGLLLYRVMDHAYQRQAAVRARLQMIASLNHHIRNALHVISLSVYSPQNKQTIEAISESVERIHRALREILPEEQARNP
jgi:signal transduction histidine kinase